MIGQAARTVGTCAWRSLVWALLPVVSGCLTGPVEGIPCADDAQCATGAFCDLPIEVCADGTAPDVQVVAVVDDGVEVIDPFVPADLTTPLVMLVENRGGAVAEDLALRMGRLECMGLVVDETAVPSSLAAGATVAIPFAVTPRLCSTPAIQDWFFSFSGRGSRGTFNIVIERAPPSND